MCPCHDMRLVFMGEPLPHPPATVETLKKKPKEIELQGHRCISATVFL